MCFSASASFLASGVLGTIGLVAVSRIKKSQQIMLASIPFLFSIQQAMEGLLWLSFSNTKLYLFQHMYVYGFLFFAFLVWPVWIPVSLYLVEKRERIKKTLLYCVTLGALISIGLLLILLFQEVVVHTGTHHIAYEIDLPFFVSLVGVIGYLLAVAFPFFISSYRYTNRFGFLLLLSYIISFLLYYHAFISVWCFFSALLSALILLMV